MVRAKAAASAPSTQPVNAGTDQRAVVRHCPSLAHTVWQALPERCLVQLSGVHGVDEGKA